MAKAITLDFLHICHLSATD